MTKRPDPHSHMTEVSGSTYYALRLYSGNIDVSIHREHLPRGPPHPGPLPGAVLLLRRPVHLPGLMTRARNRELVIIEPPRPRGIDIAVKGIRGSGSDFDHDCRLVG